MKVLQIISGQMINGALMHCHLLSRQLHQAQHQVTVLCRPNSWIAKQLVDSRIQVLHSDMRRFPTGELRRVAKFVREEKIEVIHTHMSRGNLFGVILSKMTGVPVVATAHARNMQIHWRWNDFVIANSTATEKYHRKFNLVPSRRIETIYCFPDIGRSATSTVRSLRQARRQMKLRKDLHGNEPFVVGVVGEIIRRKGQLHLFRALPEIVKAIPNFKLVLLGRYHRRESYVQQCRAIQLANRELLCKVRWLGLRPNVHDFMQGFDLCVVPSTEEPLGLVAIEAMAAGTPVVATRVGGLPEIVTPEENGLLVNSADPRGLAAAIIRMANDEEFRNQCGQSGKEMVFREFDPLRLTEQVVSVYQRVLSGRNRNPETEKRQAA